MGCHVAGGGEDSEDVALGVLVERGVVEDVGELAVAMADGQGVVGDGAFGEDPLVALAGLVGLGEVVGEVGSDEGVALCPGDLDGGVVDVGDLALGADRDERIEAGFDEAPGVLGGGVRLLIGTLALRHVAGDRRRADDPAPAVDDRRYGERDADAAAVFSDANRLVVLDALRAPDLAEDLEHVIGSVGVAEDRDVPADDLAGRVAVHPLGGGIPAGDDPFEGLADDRVVGGVDDERQQILPGGSLQGLGPGLHGEFHWLFAFRRWHSPL